MVAGDERTASDETPNAPAWCSNRGCHRASGGPDAVRVLFGDPAYLCRQCADNFDQQRMCQHCDQIYSDPVRPTSSWISCYACRRFVHRQCELKSGTSHDALLQGPGSFKCRSCRERPAFSIGGAFKRLTPSNQNGGPDAAAKGIDIIASSVAALEDDTESDMTYEGADDRDESLDFSSLILKAAEHVSSLNLQSSPTFSPASQDSTNKMTFFAETAAESISLANEAGSGSNNSCSGDGSSQDDADGKVKRRRPKAIRTERAAAIAASYASLPNMRKTILSNGDGREGSEQSVIEYDWAQCDNPRCLKWRRLPKDVPLDDLKGKWTCKLNRWDLERSSCDVEEEELMPSETLPEMKPGDGDYDAQKQDFYAQLKTFLKEISCPMLRNPTLGGKDLDLYHLYREVTQRGGFDTVVAIEGTWARIFRTLPNYSPTVTDASYRLKRYYQEFLQSFEQRMFFRKDMRDITVQKFASRRSKKSRTSDNGLDSSPAIPAVVGTPTSKSNLVAYNVPPLLKLNGPSLQCATCKRPEQQLFPCEATGTGSIRVCNTNVAGMMGHDRYLLCRSCITAYSQSRGPMALPVMSNPRLANAGNVYPSGAFSPHVNFMPSLSNLNTVNKMKTGGGNKFYQSLPVHFPSPLP